MIYHKYQSQLRDRLFMFCIFRRSALFVVLSSLFIAPLTVAQTSPRVVATFSVLADIASQIGGDHIKVSTLVEQGGDAHVFRPSPFHAQAVSKADLLIVNGLGFEGWLDRLEQSSGFKGIKVTTSKGINLLVSGSEDAHEDDHGHDEHAMDDEDSHDDGHNYSGNIDPHSWHSVANAKVYAANISDAFKAIDPDNAGYYDENYRNYVAELNVLENLLQQLAQSIPVENRKVISSHAAFGYLGRDYGLQFFSPQGVSTESEASASDVARLIRQIKDRNVKAVFFENVADNRLMSQIANETGAAIGGELYSGSLSADDGPASNYIDMMTHNMTTLVEALR